jgi:ADP-L-glycero-D-manno-heptose 6-epimerase
MKILITGSRGFIGSHAVSYWHKIGDHEIYTYEWDERTLPRIEGLDWVFHFGAISSTTERDVAKVMRQNYDFSVWLYEECRKYDVNLQWSSSASVYGLGTNFSESAPVDPRSP